MRKCSLISFNGSSGRRVNTISLFVQFPVQVPQQSVLPEFEWKLDSCFSFVFRGPPRRPPPQVQEQVKSLNQSLRLGHLLCRSRNPDFLLNIIQRQVTTRSREPRTLGGGVKQAKGIFFHFFIFVLCVSLKHISILLRPPRNPCRGWLIWFSPVRAPWMCYQYSACVNFFCMMLLMIACQSKMTKRVAVKNRKRRRDKYAGHETKHYSFPTYKIAGT